MQRKRAPRTVPLVWTRECGTARMRKSILTILSFARDFSKLSLSKVGRGGGNRSALVRPRFALSAARGRRVHV